jgi:transposase-like protein
MVCALGIDARISKSEVSRICGEVDADVTTFHDRPLSHTLFPYVFLDATYVEAHEGSSVVSPRSQPRSPWTGDGEVLGGCRRHTEGAVFSEQGLSTRARTTAYQAVEVATSVMPCDSSQRSASMAALQPSAAAVTAWR